MMQSQEEFSYNDEHRSQRENRINTDPREQQASSTHAYEEGYTGLDEKGIWSEGEKLQPEQKQQKGPWSLLLLALLLCIVFASGSLFGLILGWLSWLIVAVLILVALGFIIANWRVINIPQPLQTFQIMEHAQLTINNSAGNVSIRRGETGLVSVAATKRASGIGINPESLQILYNQRGDLLNISTQAAWNFLQFGLRSVVFEITVPETCDVQLDTGSGAATIQGTSGNIKVRTGSGRIEANELQGQISLKTGSGGIQLSQLQGQILVQTGSGGIEANSLNGQAALKTGSGGISLYASQLAGISRIQTGSGGIDFAGALDPRGSVQMQTGSGGISVALPANTAFSLDAKTGSGGVKNEFGGSEVGYEPRTRLKLRTGSGGIRIYNQGESTWLP
jgi:hypothetical protein